MSRGLVFVHAETAESPYVASRPFRVNAGAVHAYVRTPDGGTKYLSELQAATRYRSSTSPEHPRGHRRPGQDRAATHVPDRPRDRERRPRRDPAPERRDDQGRHRGGANGSDRPRGRRRDPAIRRGRPVTSARPSKRVLSKSNVARAVRWPRYASFVSASGSRGSSRVVHQWQNSRSSSISFPHSGQASPSVSVSPAEE